MTKKMVLLNASPRKNKNTAQMLESVMKGAQEAAAITIDFSTKTVQTERNQSLL